MTTKKANVFTTADLTTAEGLREAMAEVVCQLAAGTMSRKTARVLGYLARVQSRIIRLEIWIAARRARQADRRRVAQ